jgi:hypothetical protein
LGELKKDGKLKMKNKKKENQVKPNKKHNQKNSGRQCFMIKVQLDIQL